jgi:hypothetical protein
MAKAVLDQVKGLFSFLPDKPYLQLYYFLKFRKLCNFRNPKTFSEKMQWLKLYNRKARYTVMADKYAVKDYVAERIGREYIIPTLGVWDRFEDIDFHELPEQFVLKCTHDSGGLVICRDKQTLDMEKARTVLTESLHRDYDRIAREWPYKDIPRKIIGEKLMWDDSQRTGLRDYKFYCFDGEPKFLYVSLGMDNHATARMSFLNLDWTFAPFRRRDYLPFEQLPPKPVNYEKMLELARKLSEGEPFLRVDLYEIEGKIYFSELTFTPCGGMMQFHPSQWDKTLGSWIKLPEKTK